MKKQIFDIIERLALAGGLYLAIDSLGELKRLRKAELIGKLKGIAITHLDSCTNEDEKLAYMRTMVDHYKKIVEEELKLEHKTLRERRVAKVANKLSSELAWMGCNISATRMLYMLANKKASDETEEQYEEWKSEKMIEVVEMVDECVDHYTECILPLYGEFLCLIK